MKMEDEEENEEGCFMMSIGEDGKVGLYKPEDFIDVKKEDMDIIMAYLNKNKKDFTEFTKNFKKVSAKRKMRDKR